MKKNFSSRSASAFPMSTSPRSPMFGDSAPPPLTEVTVNHSLLAPLTLEIDPTIHTIRFQEKEQIKILNNRFASFIEKVRILEQQNQLLKTKWSIQQEQTTTQSNLEPMFNTYIANLHRQLDVLGNENLKLERELIQEQGRVEDLKTKYENEIHMHTNTKYEFTVLKKDADAAFMNKFKLEAERDTLEEKLNFMRAVYDAELTELHSQIKDTSVTVEMDNSRSLDMDTIVAEVCAQYEDVGKRSQAEAESWYKQKFEEMQTSAGLYGEDLRSTRAEIADTKRKSSRLHTEIDSITVLKSNLEGQIIDAEAKGNEAVTNAKDLIKNLEEALQQAKQNMTRQVREYQELMNIKLALDIEITTYKKLLEGEELRLASGQAPVIVHMQPNRHC